MDHELKINACFFNPVASGKKTFEIRRNSDRGFNAGDVVYLWEVDPNGIRTGNLAIGEITYVTNYEQKEDYVVFAFTLKQVHR